MSNKWFLLSLVYLLFPNLVGNAQNLDINLVEQQIDKVLMVRFPHVYKGKPYQFVWGCDAVVSTFEKDGPNNFIVNGTFHIVQMNESGKIPYSKDFQVKYYRKCTFTAEVGFDNGEYFINSMESDEIGTVWP